METVAFCEFDEHARKVLKKHWPDVPIHNDVRELDGTEYRGTVDVVCGGFPCQDLSNAGKKAGITGDRSSLYREMLRIISECLPRYAIFENVSALLTGDSGRWFAQFLYDLAEIGYDAEWHCIPASELGAHHHRDRVWIIAYPSQLQCDGGNHNARERMESEALSKPRDSCGQAHVADSNNDGQATTKERESTEERGDSDKARQKSTEQSERCGPPSVDELLADSDSKRQQRQGQSIKQLRKEAQRDRQTSIFESMCIRGKWEAEPELGRVADGIPNRSHRLKQLGNAVVPQIPEAIGRAIMTNQQP